MRRRRKRKREKERVKTAKKRKEQDGDAAPGPAAAKGDDDSDADDAEHEDDAEGASCAGCTLGVGHIVDSKTQLVYSLGCTGCWLTLSPILIISFILDLISHPHLTSYPHLMSYPHLIIYPYRISYPFKYAAVAAGDEGEDGPEVLRASDELGALLVVATKHKIKSFAFAPPGVAKKGCMAQVALGLANNAVEVSGHCCTGATYATKTCSFSPREVAPSSSQCCPIRSFQGCSDNMEACKLTRLYFTYWHAMPRRCWMC